MKTKNENRIVSLAQFIGFKFERIDNFSLALVRTNAPIIQINEEEELSKDAVSTINAVFDNVFNYKGKDEIDARVKVLGDAMTDISNPLWSKVKEKLPTADLEKIRTAYLSSVDSVVNMNINTVADYLKINSNFDKYYGEIFDTYNKMKLSIVEKFSAQEEKN